MSSVGEKKRVLTFARVHVSAVVHSGTPAVPRRGICFKNGPAICSPPPDLNFNGVNPVKQAAKAGNITVVALLDANCGYCLLQAVLLRRLKRKLDRKLKGITYVIINKKSAKGRIGAFGKGHGIQVYESEPKDTWKKFKGFKDDFFIYNKCGRLADYVKHPVSYLGWPYARMAILLAHKRPCKKQCPEENSKKKDASKSK